VAIETLSRRLDELERGHYLAFGLPDSKDRGWALSFMMRAKSALRPRADMYSNSAKGLAGCINAMRLKDRRRDIQTDCRN
jgi:hypothetical protein